MAFKKGVHFAPRGAEACAPSRVTEIAAAAIGEAQGVLERRALGQGHRQRRIERVAGGGGVLDLDRENRERVRAVIPSCARQP